MMWEIFKVFLLFTGCTILFYYAIMWISEEYRIQDPYEEPRGKAVKVVADHADGTHPFLERLLWFYMSGE